ncbi:hypothetical protein [Actinomadura sp. SCN-SB]|uniref:hypothetical protein n=1 Tax=Actinomadura sp. SCN-SB TaxID=3373092 RepID=UPI003752B945
MNGLTSMTGLELPEPTEPTSAHRFRLTTPVWLRTLATLAVLIAFLFAAVVSVSATDLRTHLRRAGGRAAPQALLATDLHTHLEVLDAALTAALDLDGRRNAPERRAALARFDGALARANAELQRLTAVTAGPAARRELDTVVRALTRYQTLAGQVIVLDGGSARQVRRAWDLRRTMSGLMRSGMLPAARRLADAGVRDLDRTDRERRDDATLARNAVVFLGAALLAVLGALQWTVARRHRRLISPPLVLGSLLAAALLVASAQMLHVPRYEPPDAVVSPTEMREKSFDMKEEIRALERWDVMPQVGAAVLAGLVLAGVRPRLAEFR